jgi:enoyl-CoA hydratase/carnithine racemase
MVAENACRHARRHCCQETAMPLEVSELTRHVTLITIDNAAKRNALSRPMLVELAGLWERLDASDTRCIIITGAGSKGFCAGADIGGDLSASEETARFVNRALLKTSTFSKPIIAAVNGDCAGGGVELLLSTDIRASAPHARFGLPEVRYGIYPFGGATVKLTHQIGHVHAMDLLLSGRLIDADEAARIGLINRVLPADRLMDWARATAETIAANSPAAVQAVKTQISASIADYAKSREVLEQQLGDQVRASPDFTEGVAAFREKRRPDYA